MTISLMEIETLKASLECCQGMEAPDASTHFALVATVLQFLNKDISTERLESYMRANYPDETKTML